MSNNLKERYGLIPALSMVVGIVIGLGIFFKADDILIQTNANPLLGIIGFVIVGTGVVFGSLVISQYALNSKSLEGGIIAYASEIFTQKFGRVFGFIFGWFLVSLYFPAIIVILAYICMYYLSTLLSINATTDVLFIMTFAVLVLVYLCNTLAPKISGGIQSIATFIKLIPLVLIAIVGLFLSDGTVSSEVLELPTVTPNNNFFAALISIAFAFDGWYVATSIAGELKNAKRNLPLALIGGTVIITFVYAVYFNGATNILDPQLILNLGDEHITEIGKILFGKIGGTLITLFVVISIYGGLNGMTLGYIRIPKQLVDTGLMKPVFGIEKINKKLNISLSSVFFGLFFIVVMFLIHYYSSIENTYFNNLGFDISNWPILIIYIFFIVLYLGVIKLVMDKKTSAIYLLYMTIALFVSGLVIYGTLFDGSNIKEVGIWYLVLGFIIIALGFIFNNREKNGQ